MEQDFKTEMRAMTEGLAEWCHRRERRGQMVRRVFAMGLLLVTLSALAMTTSHDFRRAVFHPKKETNCKQSAVSPTQRAKEPLVVCDTAPAVYDTTPGPTVAAVTEVPEPAIFEPIPRYDFTIALPHGDTLFCTVAHVSNTVSVSVQGSVLHPTGTLTLPAAVEYAGVRYEITALDDSAFANCRELRHITLPATLYSIGRDAFNGCSALDTIEILAAQPPEIIGEWCFWEVPGEAVLMVPCHSGAAYRNAHCWDYFDTIADTCEVSPLDNMQHITIRISGNYLIIEGVYGEVVRVFDFEGRLIASELCNGRCHISIGRGRYSYNTSAFLVQVGDSPAVKVSLPLRNSASFRDSYWGNVLY